MNTQLIRFNILSEEMTPITDLNYYLNGANGLDLNGYCTGPDYNKTCQRFDERSIPYSLNRIQIYATNAFTMNYLDCNFTYNPATARTIILNQGTSIIPILIIILIIIGAAGIIIAIQRR